MTYRSDHYHLAARTVPCTLQIHRGCPTGPTMLVHNDMGALGKGLGTKAVDIGAAGCDGCHTALRDLPRAEQHYYTMRGTIRTLAAFLERGWLRWDITLVQLRKEVL